MIERISSVNFNKLGRSSSEGDVLDLASQRLTLYKFGSNTHLVFMHFPVDAQRASILIEQMPQTGSEVGKLLMDMAKLYRYPNIESYPLVGWGIDNEQGRFFLEGLQINEFAKQIRPTRNRFWDLTLGKLVFWNLLPNRWLGEFVQDLEGFYDPNLELPANISRLRNPNLASSYAELFELVENRFLRPRR